ncbi:hypothetical protein H112_01257 [Trichophyton rubrum D6]|uniref:Uncharacterized protein n=1 Tax=Trichophyton soudanense CBS 452.61 TaxID=1215331 RepID=A0A022Y4Z6_TRISD|nr:hypothetical protein H100_01250 [Trichophyton rubrum MR850]EZF45721.1 hypothetical protein H102_01246 [Trichophyton rubrum CBS 100081]EZF77648.1 hypothetical protein H105_01261 [Trichophyton soudanense CBS 452.61]EZF88354.1 hypothetical protein H110_01257 [Trichophyton rubrum MR1448]EZG20628.1 hypothetical protein H107_01305 [Trichophyton rubrum CBS 202.88]KDB37570.1 hypothetical protein H112_01257 [Trichophyton rubrum D6]
MSYFRSTIFRHRRGNNNGSPDDEGRDNPHENQRRLATEGGKNFFVRDWIRRWSEGARGNPAKGCYFATPRIPMRSKGITWPGVVMMGGCLGYGFCWQDMTGLRYASRHPRQQQRINSPQPEIYLRPEPTKDTGCQRDWFYGSDEKEDEFAAKVFDFVSRMIPGPTSKNLPSELHAMLQLGLLLDKVADLLRNDSLDDVMKRSHVYKAAFGLVSKLSSHPELIDLAKCARYRKQQTPGLEILSSSKPQQYDSSPLILGEKIASVGERLKQLARQSKIVLESAESQDLNTRSGEDLLLCCESVLSLYSVISADQEGTGMRTTVSPQEKWEAFHQEHGVSRDEGVFDRTHAYYSKAISMTYSNPGRIKRMVTEVANMSTSLPIGIFVKVSESRPDVMKCLIMGPPDSPYGYALFEFDLICPPAYPNGKAVCLSLHGTWRDGDAAAQWQPGKSTILSVLISIQAMIFTEDPWRNEPAYTSAGGTIYGIWQNEVRAHFRYNKANILAKVDKWANENPVLKFRGIVQELKLAIEDINRR